jgi:hypothetical protein
MNDSKVERAHPELIPLRPDLLHSYDVMQVYELSLAYSRESPFHSLA